jgi:hypothetical protein
MFADYPRKRNRFAGRQNGRLASGAEIVSVGLSPQICGHHLANDWIGRVIDALTWAPDRRLTTKVAMMTSYRRGIAVFDRQAFLTPAIESESGPAHDV